MAGLQTYCNFTLASKTEIAKKAPTKGNDTSTPILIIFRAFILTLAFALNLQSIYININL